MLKRKNSLNDKEIILVYQGRVFSIENLCSHVNLPSSQLKLLFWLCFFETLASSSSIASKFAAINSALLSGVAFDGDNEPYSNSEFAVICSESKATMFSFAPIISLLTSIICLFISASFSLAAKTELFNSER